MTEINLFKEIIKWRIACSPFEKDGGFYSRAYTQQLVIQINPGI